MRRGTAFLSFSAMLALSACAFFAFAQTSENSENIVEPPARIEYDGERLSYNPAWKDDEIYIETNLDDDPGNEIIIGFIATYKPQVDNELRSDGGAGHILQEKKKKKEEVEAIQNHAFYQIYKKGPSGRYELIKTITGMDQMGKVDIFQLEEDKPQAIAFLSPGGKRYIDLSIYQWKDGGYRLLFNNGGPSGIEIDSKNKPVTVRIGETDTFVWNPQSKSFKTK